MAEMLRHNSGSIISSLQNYGDSDDEENDSKNESTNIPFADKSNDNTEHKSFIPSPTPDISSDNGITFSAKLSNTETIEEKDNNSSSKLVAQDMDKDFEQGDGEEEKPVTDQAAEISPAELISDDEGEGSHRNKEQATLKSAMKDAVAEDANPDSPSSAGSFSKPGRVAARLVSYGPDEDVDEDETSSSEEEDDVSPSNSPEAISTDNSALSRSIRNMSSEDIQIPPEPLGRCSAALQKKIEDSFDRMCREGYDLNRIIQSKKHFRNPSIYEKLIDFCHIDEKGTNFPPELYDPHIWGKESNYDELDKAQRKDMERREKEKKEKTKIEFLTGTKKSGSDNSSSGPSDEKRRKTKWDAQPPSNINIQVSKMSSAQQNPGVVNLTATATGTKATVIPAMGSLAKKPSSSSSSSGK